MARYKARWGESTYLGEEVRRWLARPVRLSRQDQPLLWQTRAAVCDRSANFLWRIEVVVTVSANSAVELAQTVEDLARGMLDQGPQDLTIRDYYTDQVVRTYPACRLDGIEPGPPPAGSLANLDNHLVFLFSSASDPL